MGVLALFASLLVLLVLPVINTSSVRSSLYRPLYQKFFWFLVADFFLLSYLGQAPAESPYIEVGQVATIYYFSFFILFVTILGRLEKGLISVRKV
jgi:ubiquinol-cytochrome c reductase cytochrome b subunit